jgi:hypothetical protein
MSHTALVDARDWKLLLEADRELAAEARARGCACGGRLHSARYGRKPRRGVPWELWEDYRWRESLCCEREGCRRRMPPPSLRFLGRRVYLGALVVLVSAMTGGVTEWRAAAMRALMGMPRPAGRSGTGPWTSWIPRHTAVHYPSWANPRIEGPENRVVEPPEARIKGTRGETPPGYR